MDNGNIVEQQNHRKLLANKGFYASLYYSQFDRHRFLAAD